MKTNSEYKTVTSLSLVKIDMLNIMKIHNIGIGKLRFDMTEFESDINTFIGLYGSINYTFILNKDHNVEMRIYLGGRIFKGTLTTENGRNKKFRNIILINCKAGVTVDLLSNHNSIYKRLELSKNFKKVELTSVNEVMSFIVSIIDDYEFEYNGDIKIDNSNVDAKIEFSKLNNRLETYFKDNDVLNLEPTIDNELRLGFKSESFVNNTLVYKQVLDKSRCPIKLELNLNNFIVSKTLKYKSVKHGRIWTNFSVCELCGSANTSTVIEKIDGEDKHICMDCYNIARNTIKSKHKYVALSGVTYTGKEATRQRSMDKLILEKERRIKDGEVFKCKSCKKWVGVKYKSKNTGICTRCAEHYVFARSLDTKRIVTKHITNEEKYDMYMKDKATPCEIKAKKAKSEQDMIAEFLAKKVDLQKL